MRKAFSFVLLPIGFLAQHLAGINLSQEILDTIDKTIFEVVVEKPVEDPLSYEKALPYNLLPYAERNDKYYSIGTAFAATRTKLVSAAHNFGLENESQFDKYFIRDRQKNIYEIDKIYKYSNHRDFVVFTLKRKTFTQVLPMNFNPQVNQKVYAVGNALGEGVIIRDGLLTSRTKEEENGAWDWIRFSAPASPGNSGGPLLSQRGELIGVILRKTENENLNYALPLSVIKDFQKDSAEVHNQLIYQLPVFDYTKLDTLNQTFTLPTSLDALRNQLTTAVNEFTVGMLEDLMRENENKIFPLDEGSKWVLNNENTTSFPNLIKKGVDGKWDYYRPNEMQTADLEKNGFIQYGTMFNMTFLAFHFPEDQRTARYYNESELFMDTLLKGVPLYRQMGAENIRITSLGKAQLEEVHRDEYGRVWRLRTWEMPHIDFKFITLSHDVPGGSVMIAQMGQTGLVNQSLIPDLKVMTRFVYFSLYGNFKEWKTYLATRKETSKVLSDFHLSYGDGQSYFRSERVKIDLGNQPFKICDKSDMTVTFKVQVEGKKPKLDISTFNIGESEDNNNVLLVFKEIRPDKSLGHDYTDYWNKVVGQKHPYDSSPLMTEENTSIFSLSDEFKKANRDSEFVYCLGVQLEGQVSKKTMKKNLSSLSDSVEILDMPR